LLKLYLRPNLQNRLHLMATHCAAAERGVLIKKERKESSCVKIKAFPTNVGRPNYRKRPCTFVLLLVCQLSVRQHQIGIALASTTERALIAYMRQLKRRNSTTNNGV